MTNPSSEFQQVEPLNQAEAEALLLSLRRKEENWLAWGNGCQRLQKGGYAPQQIFEGTGIEPIHQNQLIVAAQVYRSIVEQGISDEVRSRFGRTGSDSLYEFRILGVGDRVAAATLVVEKELDSEGAKEVARALKDFSRLAIPPDAFPSYPADAVAYHYWKLARQQGDLQERSRLIAQGLRFAASPTARQQIEKLLTDFTIMRAKKAPMLPTYRHETESEVPRVIPVVGKMPLTVDDFKAVPFPEEEGAFRLVKFSGTGAWVALPGWQAVFAADDPVAFLMSSDDLPADIADHNEEVLVLVDRANREWNEFSYYLVHSDETLDVNWFPDPPEQTILGRVLLILRPQQVLDAAFNKQPWQMDD